VSTLLTVTDLHVHFHTPAGTVRANNGINLEVREGESLGIMGESGCGKTVLFLSLLHLQQPGQIIQGHVLLNGRDITALSEREMERIRGRVIALVPQNQATALNPAYTVWQQLEESLALRRGGGGLWRAGGQGRDAAADVVEFARIFNNLGFEAGPVLDRLLRSYPHQLSGGMRQRVLIAMALVMQPRLLIADEPTTALDRAVKAQSLDALRRLRGALTMLVVSHDAEAIATACDRVAIMYGGRIVESGPSPAVLAQPRHPYSRLLLASQHRMRGQSLASPAAETLDLIAFPPGCPFCPSCPEAMPRCSTDVPQEQVGDNRLTVACHLYPEGAV